jgi:hypothetical protein
MKEPFATGDRVEISNEDVAGRVWQTGTVVSLHEDGSVDEVKSDESGAKATFKNVRHIKFTYEEEEEIQVRDTTDEPWQDATVASINKDGSVNLAILKDDTSRTLTKFNQHRPKEGATKKEVNLTLSLTLERSRLSWDPWTVAGSKPRGCRIRSSPIHRKGAPPL